ncbi:MAG: FHA domain-containing protein [Polyangiaceae bacterium]
MVGGNRRRQAATAMSFDPSAGLPPPPRGFVPPPIADNAGEPPGLYIDIFHENGSHRSVVFTKTEISVGRDKSNDLVLADEGVSRAHAMLSVDAMGQCTVLDLGSTNGTIVNDEPIGRATATLDAEDLVALGPFGLRVRYVGPPSSSQSNEAPVATPQPPPLAGSPHSGSPHSGSPHSGSPHSGPPPLASPPPAGPPAMPPLPMEPERPAMPEPPPRPEPSRPPAPAIAQGPTSRPPPPLPPRGPLGPPPGSRPPPLAREPIAMGPDPAQSPPAPERAPIAMGPDPAQSPPVPERAPIAMGPDPAQSPPAPERAPIALGPDPAQSPPAPAGLGEADLDSPTEASTLLADQAPQPPPGTPDPAAPSGAPPPLPHDEEEPAPPEEANDELLMDEPEIVGEDGVPDLSVLEDAGVCNGPMRSLLQDVLDAGLGVLVTGDDASTEPVVRALACSVSEDDHLVWLTESAEDDLPRAATTRVLGEGETRRAALLGLSELAGDRYVMPPLAGRDLLALLEAATDGSDGYLMAGAGHSVEATFGRLAASLVMAHPGLDLATASLWLASAFPIGVEMSRHRDGTRRVARLVELSVETPGTALDLWQWAEGEGFVESAPAPPVIDWLRARGYLHG